MQRPRLVMGRLNDPFAAPFQTVMSNDSFDSEDERDAILSSPLAPILKDLMKRILKASSHVKHCKEKIETAPDSEASEVPPEDALEKERARMCDLLDLFHFLWSRLLKAMYDEYERYGEIYSRTLDPQDRAPFEALTHSVHHNASFCDLLGELLDGSYERRPYDHETISDRKRAALRIYYQRMEKIQLNATLVSVLVVEGSRESFLDPVMIEDLCPTIMDESDRRKRLVHLSLMFSVLTQDEQSITEVLTQGADRVVLQRFRHLTHRLFGVPQSTVPIHSSRSRRSPLRGQRDGSRERSRRTSPHRSRRGSPALDERAFVPAMQPLPLADVRESLTAEPPMESPLPLPPAVPSFPPVEFNPPTPPAEETGRRRAVREGVSPVHQRKAQRTEENWALPAALGPWVPAIGDRVARGPGWCKDDQGAYCDFGTVNGFTEEDEVVVRWNRSEDSRVSRHGDDRGFRYSYTLPLLEVVPLEYYQESQTLDTDKETLRVIEYVLTSAVTGMICQQPEAILPALQFHTIESTLHTMDCMDLARSHAAVAEARAQAFEDQQNRFGRVADPDDPALVKAVDWSPRVQHAVRVNREQHDHMAHILWVLNGVLSHKKLCIRFLELSGLTRMQNLITSDPDGVSTALGCSVVFAHLAKHSVFEELLRHHSDHFVPMMSYIMKQWETSINGEIRTRAGTFLHYTLSFPYTLQFFDSRNGAAALVDVLDTNVKLSEEKFDVINAGVQLVALKCLNTYITAHLMLSTKVIFRKHRMLSTMITSASPYMSLPRDPATVESVLGFLWFPSDAIPDVSLENVYGLLTQDRLIAINKLTGAALHVLLLRCVNFYFVQSRWELLAAALQGLCVLTVVPYIRQMVAEPRPNETGIPILLAIISDLTASYAGGNTSRASHLLPCVLSALQVLVQVTTPRTDAKDDAQVASFNRICSTLRVHDGVRILLDLLKIRKDTSLSAKLHFFPVIARAVQLMVVLQLFGDTSQLFEALGVHRVAQDLLQEYMQAQREYISLMGQRRLLTDQDPADRFVENVKWLMPQAFGDSYQIDTVRAPPADPVEMEMRRAIVAHANIDYTQQSLFSLMAEHLESQGLHSAAYALRTEAGLNTQAGIGRITSSSSSAPSVDTAPPPVSDSSKTLDGMVRSYLRQQQERCPNPIETLPRFDLTKKHIYIPPPPAADLSRNAFDRMLSCKINQRSLAYAINDNCLTYRNPAFIFDIMSEGDLQGESICFCDGGDAIITGTSEGSIYVFDTFPEETMDKLLEQHIVFENEGITSLVMSPDETLLGIINERYDMKITPRSALSVVRYELSNCRAARFSRDSSKLLITCGQEHMCRLTDLTTQQDIAQFSDREWSGDNLDKVAQFDATSTLVLHDAVLWDLRCSNNPIFRFDRITESFASAFHPPNQKIIIDEKIWDLRTLQIIQTVPVFHKTNSFHMNEAGKVIYSFREATAAPLAAASIVSAVDSYSFEVIFSEEVQPTFKSFALDPSDRYCAALLDENRDCPLRVFSTASGPHPERRAFAAPAIHENQDDEAEEDEEDEDEAELDGWSMSDDMDLDDDDEDEEDIDSSISYSGDEEFDDDDDDDDEDDDDDDSSTGTDGDSHTLDSSSYNLGGGDSAVEDAFTDEEDEEDDDEEDDEEFDEAFDNISDDDDEDEEFDEAGVGAEVGTAGRSDDTSSDHST